MIVLMSYTHPDQITGIIRCDMIAESIIGAATALGPLRVPLVVRLQGTNSAEGLKLVCQSSVTIIHSVLCTD